jgi:F0F1-type ATP synthase assembly protein I
MSKDSKGPQASSGIGFALVALIVLFMGAGYGMDRWLHTTPWLMVTGVFVGFGLGLVYVVLILSGGSSGRRTRRGRRDDGKGPNAGSS